MRILHDYQILIRQKIGGISRYHYEIVRNIKKIGGELDVEVPTIFSRNYYFQEFYGKKALEVNCKYVNYLIRIINEVYTFIKICIAYFVGKPYNVIHLSWYAPFYLKPVLWVCKKYKPRIVVTVHDLVHEMEAAKSVIMSK